MDPTPYLPVLSQCIDQVHASPTSPTDLDYADARFFYF